MDNFAETTALARQEASGKPKPIEELSIEEVQRAILQEIAERLKDPRALNLEYPNAFHHEGSAPEIYENGAQIRILGLNAANRFGEIDELCLAMVDNNLQTEATHTLGSGFLQVLKGNRTNREIGVSRFQQSKTERFRGGGTYSRIHISDSVQDTSGTSSTKGRSYEKRIKDDMPTFTEHWKSGNAQVGGIVIYDVAGTHEEFTDQDYRDVLSGIRRGKVDVKATQLVAKNETKMSNARIKPSRIDAAKPAAST